MEHEITSDGRTVWVNGPFNCLGRFGPFGIDIHRSFEEQKTTGNECLHCTHGGTTRADWDTFVVKMKEHYGVEVGPEHMPKALR